MYYGLLKSRLSLVGAIGVSLIPWIPSAPARADATTTANLSAPQESKDVADVQQIEEVTVTARRVTERLQDVPISITVFNQQQLAEHNISTASDLAAITPSLSANTEFGPDNSSFSIRGFTQEIRTTPSVAVYFADVVAPRGGGINTTAGDGAGPGNLFDLQNVQVLKGPQGTLFGRNTTGGAVLLVPNKPTDQLEGYLEASAGDYGMQRVQGVLNAPISDKVRLRLGFDEQTRDGYEKNISDIGPSSFGNINYYALRASLVVDVTSNVENYTIASYSHSDNHDTLPQVFACNPKGGEFPFWGPQAVLGLGTACAQVARLQGQSYWTVDNGNPAPRSLNDVWQIINTTTWHESDSLTIKNINSYAQLRNIYSTNPFGDDFTIPGTIPSLSPPFSASTGALAGTPISVVDATVPPGMYSNAQSTFTEELQFQGNELGNRIIWQGGVYYELSEPLETVASLQAINSSCTNLSTLPPQCIDSLGYLYSEIAFGPPPNGNPLVGQLGGSGLTLGRVSYRNLGLYGQATYDITSQLKITGGLRYTEDLTHGAGSLIDWHYPAVGSPVPKCVETTGNPATGDCWLYERQLSHAPTGTVDLDYTPVEDVMVYAKYSRGYRQGGVYPDGPPGFNTYNPEHVNAYEVGAKTGFDGLVKGTFDFAAFYNDLTNQQLQFGFAGLSTDLAVAPTTGIVNAGKSRIFGGEIESSLIPFENFRLDLSGAYLDSRLESEQIPPSSYIPEPTDAVGAPLPLTPKYKASVTGTYTLPVPESLGKVSVGANYVYTSKMLSADPNQTPFAYLVPSNLVSIFVNWDAIDGSPISASFFMTNVTDDKYETFVPGLYSAFGFDSRFLGQPRMFGFRLRYDFGG